MRKSVFTLLICAFVITAKAQDFVPYNAFGVQLSKRFTNLNVRESAGGDAVSTGRARRGFDLVAQYDKGVKKWYGVGAGIGLSSIGSGVGNSKELYYAVLPLRLQLKAGSVWFEPGLENRFFLWMDEGVQSNYVNPESVNLYHLAGNLTLRFKLFRGLSIHSGISTSITPVVTLKKYDTRYGETYYNSISGFVGVRYMFNQPYD